MFASQRWAEAFVKSMGEDAEEAFAVFRIFVSWANKLPGAVFGTASSIQAERILKKAGEQVQPCSGAYEKVMRFIVLLIKKNCLRHSAVIIKEIQKSLDIKNNVLPVILESVYPPGDFEIKITDLIRERTGAEVRLEKKIKPELIGGYRLKIGDKVIDASILTQLTQMETALINMAAESMAANPIGEM